MKDTTIWAGVLSLALATSVAIEVPKDRLPDGFISVKPANMTDKEIINSKQIIKVVPTWDPGLPAANRTDRNKKWSYIVMSDNSTLYVDEESNDLMNRIRNQQR